MANMTASEKRKIRKAINNKLADLSKGHKTLGEWLKEASELHPDLEKALDGSQESGNPRAIDCTPSCSTRPR